MTNDITTAKAQFADALTSAGLRVLEYVPERMVPPIVVIAAGANYLERSSVSNEFILKLEVLLVAQNATNAMATENLDALIQNAINALPAFARFVSIGQPYALQTNSAEYLSANMQVDLRITL